MPYRDDEHALHAKKEQLEQERTRIEEHKRALANLAEDEARVNDQLADVERRLAKRKKSLPVLGEVRVASPCHADWNEMVGDDQSRFCDKCAKNVYNLSAMTTEQAESLIREKEGQLCVRYYQRADGTVITADCPVGVRKKRVKAVAFVTAFGAVGAGLFAFEESTVQGKMVDPGMRMGKMEAFDLVDVQVDQKDVGLTMGMVALPDSQQEETVEKVENGAGKTPRVESTTKAKKPQPPVERKAPSDPLRRRF